MSTRRALHVQLTGFGPFGGVPVNPTSKIVAQLASYLEANPLPDHIHIDDKSVLHVSATGSLAQFRALEHRTAATDAASSSAVRVWLHLGVNSKAEAFALENQAYNLADFRIPDENQWTPSEEIIDAHAPSTIVSALNVDEMCKRLQQGGHKVVVSTDPGRFVCNWVYFHSLQRSLESGAYSLFVHVPSEATIDLPTQLRFVRDLLVTLGELVHEPAPAPPAGDAAAALSCNAVRRVEQL